MSDHSIFLSRLALPVSWETLDRAPSSDDCDKAASANAGVVSFLLHAVDLEAVPRPSDESLVEALAPLRIKLDMIIDMLGRLTYRDVVLPPVCDIELGMSRMAWQSPRPLRPGKWVRIKLYFDAKILEPIVLYGRVESSVGDEDSGGCGIQAELAEIPPHVEESFARLAFLAQRRQLAQRPAAAARSDR
jgi:hypothetical protein